jgi:DnaK suppressor protein
MRRTAAVIVRLPHGLPRIGIVSGGKLRLRMRRTGLNWDTFRATQGDLIMLRSEYIRKVKQQLFNRREALRRSLAGDMRSLRNMQESGVGDEVDASHVSEQMELGGQLAQVESRELSKINEALDRIRTGRYGKCDTCGNSIKTARLQAVPHATECIDCARAAERRRVSDDNPRGFSREMSHEEVA